MRYSIKEIFHTLQGEGAHSGRAAVFCRFAGCNLWTGNEKDRPSAVCKFCDTDFLHTDGTNGGKYSLEELLKKIGAIWMAESSDFVHRFVVLTGGEPTLQTDLMLVRALKQLGFEIAIETNGTREVIPDIDWITVSPKAGSHVVQVWGHELKLVYPQPDLLPGSAQICGISDAFEHLYLQPMDGPDLKANTAGAIQICRENPRWKLSVQQHKLLGLP